MALSATTLASAITAAKLQNIAIANTAGFADKQLVRIDNEYMYQVGPATTTSGAGAITVKFRGSEGTAAVAHDVLAIISTSPTMTDFPAFPTGNISPIPPSFDDVATIGQDVTITPPTKNTTYYIAKGSACNITLNSASPVQAGVNLAFISNSPYAHVVTYAAGFRGGVNTVATFATQVGATLMAEAGQNGVFAETASRGVTLSS